MPSKATLLLLFATLATAVPSFARPSLSSSDSLESSDESVERSSESVANENYQRLSEVGPYNGMQSSDSDDSDDSDETFVNIASAFVPDYDTILENMPEKKIVKRSAEIPDPDFKPCEHSHEGDSNHDEYLRYKLGQPRTKRVATNESGDESGEVSDEAPPPDRTAACGCGRKDQDRKKRHAAKEHNLLEQPDASEEINGALDELMDEITSNVVNESVAKADRNSAEDNKVKSEDVESNAENSIEKLTPENSLEDYATGCEVMEANSYEANETTYNEDRHRRSAEKDSKESEESNESKEAKKKSEDGEHAGEQQGVADKAKPEEAKPDEAVVEEANQAEAKPQEVNAEEVRSEDTQTQEEQHEEAVAQDEVKHEEQESQAARRKRSLKVIEKASEDDDEYNSILLEGNEAVQEESEENNSIELGNKSEEESNES